MKKLYLVLLLSFLSSTAVYAVDPYPNIYLSPGIKYGYVFGEKGGSIFGFELSCFLVYTRVDFFNQKNSFFTGSKDVMAGLLFGIDCFRDTRKINLNAEIGVLPFGISIGPSFIKEKDATDIGVNITPYVTWLVLPYYNYTLRFGHDDIHEFGGYLKIPIRVKEGKGTGIIGGPFGP